MPIDPAAAMAAPQRTEEIAWTERDVLLYHLSLGAGHSADPELLYTYERGRRVLPTFATVARHGISAGARTASGLAFDDVNVEMLNGATDSLLGLEVRFAGTLSLGQTIHVKVWAEGDGLAQVASTPDRGDAAILMHGRALVAAR